MRTRTRNFIIAMLQGMTGAGLFRRLRYPGAPEYVIDPRSVDEILAGGDLGEELTRKLREYEKLNPHSDLRGKDAEQSGG